MHEENEEDQRTALRAACARSTRSHSAARVDSYLFSSLSAVFGPFDSSIRCFPRALKLFAGSFNGSENTDKEAADRALQGLRIQ